MPIIPFLSLSSGGRSRRRKGQKGCLGELRVAEDTKRTSRWPSEGWMVMAAPEAELEDEAAGRQYASKASVPAYSELTALPPALFLFRNFLTTAAQGDGPKKFKELAPSLAKLYRRSGHVQMLLLPRPPRRPFCPFRLLDLPPKERDKKGITSSLSVFSL